MPSDWSPTSWKSKAARFQPEYADADSAHLEQVIEKLHRLPPLVTSWEIERLKQQIAEAAVGQRFVLQGGDCAESLDDCTPDAITSKLKILLQMSLVLVLGAQRPVVRIGRFAGQYAKPRTSPTETRDDVTLPSYFGDLVNQFEFNDAARRPNPHLLLRGYEHAAMTLNFIRSLIDGGFADLHHPEYWDLGFCDNAELRGEYLEMVERIQQSLQFMESVADVPVEQLTRVEFFTSHEGLNLLYESAGTRTVPRREGFYDLTTHFPWIGDRTRDLDEAHVEFFRGIQNPIGVKIGPTFESAKLAPLLERLNPKNEPGRLTLIHRFGADRVDECLPRLIEAVKREGRSVAFFCDPMHGNTTATSEGRKTRRFDAILEELNRAFDIHEDADSVLAGVHFELTGEHVTECVGGARGLSETDLAGNYRSPCDPRLNYEQALEFAFLIARRLGRRQRDAETEAGAD